VILIDANILSVCQAFGRERGTLCDSDLPFPANTELAQTP
jgi:hypothetical protein